jgi:hypothetical protein
MKIIYTGYLANRVRPRKEWDYEVRDAVDKALELVEGKNPL